MTTPRIYETERDRQKRRYACDLERAQMAADRACEYLRGTVDELDAMMERAEQQPADRREEALRQAVAYARASFLEAAQDLEEGTTP
jgi:hypothetical protein